MPRLMSVSLTADAVLDRRKTVTRRLGWKFLKPGDRLILCPKTRGVSKAERVELAEVEVVSVRRERLCDMPFEDVAAEGFPPTWTVRDFIVYFALNIGAPAEDTTEVTRIEWRYL